MLPNKQNFLMGIINKYTPMQQLNGAMKVHFTKIKCENKRGILVGDFNLKHSQITGSHEFLSCLL